MHSSPKIRNSKDRQGSYASKSHLILIRTLSIFIFTLILLLVGNVFGDSRKEPLRSITISSGGTTNQNEAVALDRAVASEIASSVAAITSMPEKADILNSYTLLKIQESLAANDNVVSKPQVIQAGKVYKGFNKYRTVAGDTVQSVAAKHGVSDNSVRWSNKLTDDTITAGTDLMIPPVDGIVYTVGQGETPDILATRFRADITSIISYNDAELKGIQPGQVIVIPNGQLPLIEKQNRIFGAAERFNPVMDPTAYVKAGDTVGYVGNTGYSFGSHLHLEANLNGATINPNVYIGNDWQHPTTGIVSQSYNNPSRLYSTGFHSGIDYDPGHGAPVKAVADGILYRGCQRSVLGYSYGNGLGYMAIIDHGNGLKSVYAHMVAGPDGGACNY